MLGGCDPPPVQRGNSSGVQTHPPFFLNLPDHAPAHKPTSKLAENTCKKSSGLAKSNRGFVAHPTHGGPAAQTHQPTPKNPPTHPPCRGGVTQGSREHVPFTTCRSSTSMKKTHSKNTMLGLTHEIPHMVQRCLGWHGCMPAFPHQGKFHIPQPGIENRFLVVNPALNLWRGTPPGEDNTTSLSNPDVPVDGVGYAICFICS